MYPQPNLPYNAPRRLDPTIGISRPRFPRMGLPSRRTKRWPAWSWLADTDQVLFLDIETTGLSRFYDVLTMVGYQVGGRHHVLLAGEDPGQLLSALTAAKCVVTYNGTLFDLPFLRDTFPGLSFDCPHLDLRFAARRVGLVGGQKAIEREIASSVRTGLEDIDGWSAVLLWHRYLRGDRQALRDLIAYNLADVLGMRDILDAVRSRMSGADQGELFGAPPPFAGVSVTLTGLGDPAAAMPAPPPVAAGRSFAEVFGGSHAVRRPVVGIDLTGSEAKPSGFCVLHGPVAATRMLGSDDDIVSAVVSSGAGLVSIDSPLSLPRGRLSVNDDDPGRREFGIMRRCERTLKRRGINVYPCLLPSMQRLTARGIQLANRLKAAGIAVIESYPGAAQDIMGIPRKGAGEELLSAGLAEFGLSGDFVAGKVRHDELDAITSALVGYFFLDGQYEGLGGEGENALIVPKLSSRQPARLVIGLSGRIGSGKTTAARRLEARGFRYARYSQVVDEVILVEGLPLDRMTRQAVGWRLHEEMGQGWLLDRLLEACPSDGPIVIDGLRFPEDRANLVERFGAGFVHLDVKVCSATRAQRLGMCPDSAAWSMMEKAPTEAQVDTLSALADAAVCNEGDLDAFRQAIDAAMPGIFMEAFECRSA